MAVTPCSPELIPELQLHEFNRNIGSLIPKSGAEALQGYERSPEDFLSCLLFTVGQPQLAPKHRTVACNALSSFLSRGIQSSSELHELCLKPSIWYAALTSYIERSDDAGKPMKQLLVALVKILGEHKQSSRDTIVEATAERCLDFILGREDLSSVKPSLLVLEIMLSKGSLTPRQLLAVAGTLYGKARHEQEACQIPNQDYYYEAFVTEFVCSVLSWAYYAHIAPAATKFLLAFFKATQSQSDVVQEESSVPLWMHAIQRMTAKDDEMLEILQRQTLPDLLKLDSKTLSRSAQANVLLDFLRAERLVAGDVGNMSERDVRFCLLIFACADGGNLGSRRDINSSAVADYDLTLLSKTMYLLLLDHASSSVRTLALVSLFPGTRAQPATMLAECIQPLLANLPAFHCETDAQYRMEFIGILRRMFSCLALVLVKTMKMTHGTVGIDAETAQVAGNGNELLGPNSSSRLIAFLERYFDFICVELQPSASYQRHFTALRAIKHVASTGLLTASQIEIMNFSNMRSLFDLVMDPFDDIRTDAVTLLKKFPRNMLRHTCVTDLDTVISPGSLLDRAERMLCFSSRADHADGVGRLYDIFFESCLDNDTDPYKTPRPSGVVLYLLEMLEHDVALAAQDFAHAVASAPIHGRLIALRYIMTRGDIVQVFEVEVRWREFHSRLICCLKQIWEIVRPVLCVDSPEGNADYDEDENLDIGIKDTLSYSWRTLKEASSLLKALLSNHAYGMWRSEKWLRTAEYKAIGDLSFTQLAELRHRGAFSSVAQAFAACCIQCVDTCEQDTAVLLEHWYRETVKCIHQKASALTRRSAGLPAMICGVLTPHYSDTFFKTVIRDLRETAMAPAASTEASATALPQVHALNCLKDVFTNSRLAARTDTYLAEAIKMAVRCLESNIWAIRNCGIMLFKALLTRLVGGSGGISVQGGATHYGFFKAAYEKFPQLGEIVVEQLRRNCDLQYQAANGGYARQMQVGFPAMEIIDRVGVSLEQQPVVCDLLLQILGSPVWNIREKAARTLSTFATALTLLSNIASETKKSKPSQNRLHGHLMCLKYILKSRSWCKEGSASTISNSSLAFFDTLVSGKQCPFVVAEYLNTLSCLLQALSLHVSKDSTNGKRQTHRLSENGISGRFQETLRTVSNKLAQSQSWLARTRAFCSLSNSFVHLRAQAASYQSWGNNSTSIPYYYELVDVNDPTTMHTSLLAFEDHPPKCAFPELEHFLDILPRALGSCSIQYDIDGVLLCHLTYLTESCCDITWPLEDMDRLSVICYQISSVLDIASVHTPKEPSAVTRALIFQGALIRFLEKHSSQPWSRKDRLTDWGRRLLIALHERSELDQRIAAAKSIYNCRDYLRSSDMASPKKLPYILPVYMAIYNALLDDDDEVRDIAASVVSWILSKPAALRSWNPYIAVSHLLQFLTDAFTTSPSLCMEGISRVTGHARWISSEDCEQYDLRPSKQFSVATHAQRMFESAMKQDTTLFVEEKQNLYLDEVLEAERWATVLRGLNAPAYSNAVMSQIIEWVRNGLDTLIALAESNKDGPLGWTSKVDVFIAGMRLLGMTEVALCWSGEDSVVSVKQQLARLHAIGLMMELNWRWQGKIEALLAD